MSRILGQVLSDTRELARDPVALIFTFVMPFVLVAALAPIYVSLAGAAEVTVGVVAADDDVVASLVVERLEASPALEVETYDDRAAAELGVRRRDIVAAIVVPSGVDGDPHAEPAEVQLIGSPEVALPTGVRAAVENSAAEAAAVVVVAGARDPAVPLAASVPETARLADVAFAEGGDSVDLTGRRDANVASATLRVIVLFMFLNVTAKSAQMARYRELGVLARLQTTGMRPATLVAGFAVSNVVYTMGQGALLMLGSTLFIGVVWAQPLLVVTLLMLAAVAAASMGTLVGFVLPTSRVVSTLAAPVVFVAAMLGGALWPLDIVGSELSAVGHLTPHAWAIDALTAAVFLRPVAGWLVPATVLLAYSVLFMILAAVWSRRALLAPT